MGVLFTIPLRRALIVETPLKFPEGVATAEVLKVGDTGGSAIKYLVWAGTIGALFKLGETGFKLWGAAKQAAWFVGNTVVYVGSNLSPALVGVGYIVGLNIAALIFIGGAINYLIAIPIVIATQGLPAGITDPVGAANTIWSAQTRYLGVGAMVVGGLWALVNVRRNIVSGIKSGAAAYRRIKAGEVGDRLERDTPMQWVGMAMVFSIVPVIMLFSYFTDNVGVGFFMAVVMVIAGFLFSAVAGYMAGLVGSSNNPISGVTIATILTAALLLAALLGTDSIIGPAAAVLIGAVVACSAAIAADNMQDLKAGRILGATPYKQQIMQFIGVIAAALVIAPVLSLILDVYGIGPVQGLQPTTLAAPQASLMAAVAQGVFSRDLPWTMIFIGMAVAAGVIVLDKVLESRESTFRTPVLAVAVGIHLPFQLSVAIFMGGLVAWAVSRANDGVFRSAPAEAQPALQEARASGDRHGLLFAAGLITGEALVGILVAIPIAATRDANVLAFWGDRSDVTWPGMILLALVITGLFRVASGVIREHVRS
jgi:putative OPT family oligopeptide transporter